MPTRSGTELDVVNVGSFPKRKDRRCWVSVEWHHIPHRGAWVYLHESERVGRGRYATPRGFVLRREQIPMLIRLLRVAYHMELPKEWVERHKNLGNRKWQSAISDLCRKLGIEP